MASNIVRLKGLDKKASAEDIRDFFKRFHIPGGGVYILGGPQREAFVAFTSEDEARRAARYTGRPLKGSKVEIRRSNISELEHKLKYFLKRRNRSSSKSVSKPTKTLEGTLTPSSVHPQSSRNGLSDPRTVLTLSPMNSSSDTSGFLQTSDKPQNPLTSPPFVTGDCPQPHSPRISPPLLPKPDNPKSVPFCVLGGCPKTLDNPRTPRTIPHFVAGGSPPQVCDERQDPRCAKTPDKPHHPRTSPPVGLSKCPQQPSSESLHDAFFLGVFTALEQLQSWNRNEHQEILPGLDWQDPNKENPPEHTQTATVTTPPPGYLRLFGVPGSTTKEDICSFFEGLSVQEVVVNVKLQHRRECLVKFGDVDDALDALQFNRRSMGNVCVEIHSATELMWTKALEECENAAVRRAKPKQSSLTYTQKHKRKARLNSPMAIKEYIVMVCNISVKTTKTELRKLLGYPEMASSNIQHLLDKNRCRTDTAFLIFNRKEDFEHALTHDGCCIFSKPIKVSAVSREEMNQMLAQKDHPEPKYGVKAPKSAEKARGKKLKNLDPEAKSCLLVENLPVDTNESLIIDLFNKYKR
ncbi:RNA binding motif protein 12Ba [Dunckerocampus dactyliophorus]|uniref:RNA binding motif protein 12Ba n=1 Tax=Dunckerocampus dactyliophorus TaxID=161453 RepID=UPI0024051499|nr:RNA binding motif protein 12Ba [Dunckerocampus dactyliophorus]